MTKMNRPVACAPSPRSAAPLRALGFAAAVTAAVLASCSPPPPVEPEPEYDPAAFRPEESRLRNVDVVAASERIVPYDVERGGTVYAIRDLIDAASRIRSQAETTEAWFLAAAATLDLMLYADLTGDSRPVTGLEGAWGADGRNGIVAAVTERIGLLAGRLVPAVMRNALAIARALASPDHAANLDAAALNAMVVESGPLAFPARVLLLDLHASLMARAATEGPGPMMDRAAAWGAGLPEPGGETWGAAPSDVRAAARLLLFADLNAAAIREAAPDEPLAALLGSWLEDKLAVPFTELGLPIRADMLRETGRAPASAFLAGRAPGARVFLFASPDRVWIGVTGTLRIVEGGVTIVDPEFGDGESPLRACAVPSALPEPPRRFNCVRTALADALAVLSHVSAPAVALAATDDAQAPLAAALLREAVAAGFGRIELTGSTGGDGLASVVVSFAEEPSLVSVPGTVRIAAGGFYVGKRGNIVQVPRAAGAYDYGTLMRVVAPAAPPWAILPSEATSWPVILGAACALSTAGAPSGISPVLLPPQ